MEVAIQHMSLRRRAVLVQLAAMSDADRRETTTIESLIAELDADRSEIKSHLETLRTCQLARLHPDGQVRVTITGEELLELVTGEIVIVDPRSSPAES